MIITHVKIENIPAILWGEKSDKIYVYVHGKGGCKEEAESFANIANPKGYQVLSFDLPEHGERKTENLLCVAWNGVYDIQTVLKYIRQGGWNEICLYACSLGAYFSLLAFQTFPLQKCLFLSPVLDMERIIQNMMKWFHVSEQVLKEKGEIPTPMGETLSYKYYCYAKENLIDTWNVPTAILYGSEDTLTEREVINNFTNQFHCNLTILEGGEHWFHTQPQLAFLNNWLNITI